MMRKFLVNKLLGIDYFNALIFGVSLIAGVFALRDVFQFDRIYRGICGLVLCCISIGFLIGGRQRIAILALFGHYLFVLISAQIDTDLALVHLNFIGNKLTVSGYHSPYKGIAHSESKKICPIITGHSYSADNVLVLQYNDFCQFVIEVGSENYANYVLFVSIAVFPFIGIVLLIRYIVAKCLKPKKKVREFGDEFNTPTHSPTRNSNQMVSSFMSTSMQSYI